MRFESKLSLTGRNGSASSRSGRKCCDECCEEWERNPRAEIGTNARAATIAVSYEETITVDSGLGLIGQTMQVNLSYDDTTAGSNGSASSGSFNNAITPATVTIGANSWILVPLAFSSITTDNDIALFSFTSVDCLSLTASLTGSDLGTGTSDGDFSLFIALRDTTPLGAADGLAAAQPLPPVGPDADPFVNSSAIGSLDSSMSLSWSVGGEEGVSYSIETNDVGTAAAPAVPGLTKPVAMLLAGLLLAMGLRSFSRRIA